MKDGGGRRGISTAKGKEEKREFEFWEWQEMKERGNYGGEKRKREKSEV